MTDATPLLEVTDLVKHYAVRGGVLRRRIGTVHAVDGVSFELMPKEALAVVGESGCGKSTLALTLMGLERPTSGSIRFAGQELSGADGTLLKAARRQMQMVFRRGRIGNGTRVWRMGDVLSKFRGLVLMLQNVSKQKSNHAI